MQVNLDCNCPKPQFCGFKVPTAQHDIKILIDYANLGSSSCYQGYRHFVNKANKLKHFDIEFLPKTRTMSVIEKLTNQVRATFEASAKGITGVEHFGSIMYPGKKSLTALFNPIELLPYNMLESLKFAQKLERKTEQMLNLIEKLK